MRSGLCLHFRHSTHRDVAARMDAQSGSRIAGTGTGSSTDGTGGAGSRGVRGVLADSSGLGLGRARDDLRGLAGLLVDPRTGVVFLTGDAVRPRGAITRTFFGIPKKNETLLARNTTRPVASKSVLQIAILRKSCKFIQNGLRMDCSIPTMSSVMTAPTLAGIW